MNEPMRLVDRHPQLTADELVKRFHPPHRFDDVRFDTYEPDPAFPSQRHALEVCKRFAATEQRPTRRFWQRPTRGHRRQGFYLDGGFGVGKTHLLASMWHSTQGTKAYLTFTDLTAFIGFIGMEKATATFRDHQLLCIDEFELDDVANTLMVVSFLRGAMQHGLRVAVTSNTLPESLGEGRFSAADFRREIAAIASHFEELRIDGPDFRTSHASLPLATHDSDMDHTTRDDFEALLPHLRTVHPAQYGALLDDVDRVDVHGLRTIDNQGDALLFVQFVDKVYDARIPVRMMGCATEELFAPDYRHGGFRKKYGRAESRIAAMQLERLGHPHAP